MTWQSASAAAAILFEKIKSRRGFPPAKIVLAIYESQADLNFLRGYDEWPLTYHTMVMRALARRCRKAGVKTELASMNINDYFDWLAATGQRNSQFAREKFVTEKTSQK
jgi:hypothetical protein